MTFARLGAAFALVSFLLAASAAGQDARQLFLQAIEAHRTIERATFGFRVFDVIGSEGDGAVAQLAMVVVERAAQPGAMPKFNIRGASIDHHPLGVRLINVRPVAPVLAAYDGRTLTIVDDIKRETRIATDPDVVKVLAHQTLWFIPTWFHPQPFRAEQRLMALENAAIAREADALVFGVPCFVLRLKATRTFEMEIGGESKPQTYVIDNSYYFEKDRKILRRIVERRPHDISRVSEVEFLKVNPTLMEEAFNVYPPEEFTRKEIMTLEGTRPR